MKNNKIIQSTEPSENTLVWALIRQLTACFSLCSEQFTNFKKLSLVGPRRNNFQSHVCRRLDNSCHTVLKSFSDLSELDTWKLVAYELIVPLLVDSSHVVQFRSVFIHKNVRFTAI